ncbi:hypothetical protein ACRAWD_03650 [Caulobacter segnis]
MREAVYRLRSESRFQFEVPDSSACPQTPTARRPHAIRGHGPGRPARRGQGGPEEGRRSGRAAASRTICTSPSRPRRPASRVRRTCWASIPTR